MTTQSLQLSIRKFDTIISTIKNDIVFSTSLFLALASCLLARPSLDYINFKVLVCLFNLMIVVKAFEELSVLDFFATGILNKCSDSRRVSLILIALSFFSSMFITNDIALITLIPLTLIISRKSGLNLLATIILQTLAANIGSSLTPMGNPQNLYIFSYYNPPALQFFLTILPFTGTGLILLYLLNHRAKSCKLDVSFEPIKIKGRFRASVWAVLFGAVILSVFGIIDYRVALIITLVLTSVLDRSLFRKADYTLLATFVCFFVFIGNMSSIPALDTFMKSSLSSGRSTYIASIILSQFISNVPCSVFLSKFTTHWQQLLLGVDIGGMGTIIASLASVISYKLYIKEYPEKSRKYLSKFSIYNIASLILFAVGIYVITGLI